MDEHTYVRPATVAAAPTASASGPTASSYGKLTPTSTPTMAQVQPYQGSARAQGPASAPLQAQAAPRPPTTSTSRAAAPPFGPARPKDSTNSYVNGTWSSPKKSRTNTGFECVPLFLKVISPRNSRILFLLPYLSLGTFSAGGCASWPLTIQTPEGWPDEIGCISGTTRAGRNWDEDLCPWGFKTMHAYMESTGDSLKKFTETEQFEESDHSDEGVDPLGDAPGLRAASHSAVISRPLPMLEGPPFEEQAIEGPEISIDKRVEILEAKMQSLTQTRHMQMKVLERRLGEVESDANSLKAMLGLEIYAMRVGHEANARAISLLKDQIAELVAWARHSVHDGVE
ncbi:hypothetical protein CDD81_4019 [Ophiocordyceps australis]|uniref:Uncharacterized protein n=1 Tax=Ophiocordyceps australis TaxID=1399860 RepID=A0A2C5Y7S5_9HYPO|nr:hypothetical protein CDD81_4019 [Ophiocordyceps australis]